MLLLLAFSYHERPLLLGSLEAAVTELGGGVDEFEFDRFSGLAGCVLQQRLHHGTGREEHFILLLLHP